MSDVVVMDQLPKSQDINAKAESPLSHVTSLDATHDKKVDDTKIDSAGVLLREDKYLGHLLIRGNSADEAFNTAINHVLGAGLPKILQCVYVNDLSIRWVSPDEWLVICPGDKAYDLENQLRAAMQGHYAIVNVSGGQTLLILSGKNARDVLMKSTAYDVDDSHFPVGKAVTSTFAKSQALICRQSEEVWELVIRRSFADYIWLWLEDASREFG